MKRLREKKTFKVWKKNNSWKNKSSIIICFFYVKTIEILDRTPFFPVIFFQKLGKSVQVKIGLISDIDCPFALDAS
jgi:hypothetical protein